MRSFIRTAAVVCLTLLAPAASAQNASSPPPAPETIDIMTLMAPGPLPEKTLGDPKAPVTLIEYASMTCSHCGNFYRTTFDPLKAKYIDTGKVRFVFREFPLDQLALAAAAIARCGPEDKYFDMIDTMFRQQDKWAYVEQPGTALITLLEPFGVTDATVEACIGDKTLIQNIVAGMQKAGETFGVRGTPAFFINGKRYGGEMSLEEMDAAIAPLLPATP